MDFKSVRQILMMTALSALPFGVQAASVTAQVSANIVPISSFSISGAALFSGSRNEGTGESTVHLSASGTGDAATLKIHNDSGHAYDVSVSLPTNSDDEFYSELKIVDSQLTLNQASQSEKGEQQLEFGGAIEMENIPEEQSHTGYVYITTNFY